MSNRRSALYTLCLFEAFPSRGNEKYGEEKQRVIYFMYHSAVSPFGGERSEPITRMRIMPYDTESQSRNVLASPLGEEGHEVAKGWTRVRMIMILLFYVLSPFAQGAADWRSGPRWSILSVLCPVHPFPLRGTSPQGETRK